MSKDTVNSLREGLFMGVVDVDNERGLHQWWFQGDADGSNVAVVDGYMLICCWR